MRNTLIVLLGPTAVGKTDAAIALAEHFQTSIVSADSRQIYKGLNIGTASPEEDYLRRVPHYFIDCKSVDENYNASFYEADVLKTLESLFLENPVVVLTGGSMMYIDAVTKGIDEMPDVDPLIRKDLMLRLRNEGLESLRLQLKTIDPEFYAQVDLKNHSRIIHALEISIQTGLPYSSFLTNQTKQRTFNIVKLGLDRPREELYARINQRVELMMEQGLVDEARQFEHLQHFNALNTVGYKEVFAYLKGECDLPRAIELIQRNSRRYAKKQLSWFRRDKDIHWYHPDSLNKLLVDAKQLVDKATGIV